MKEGVREIAKIICGCCTSNQGVY